MSTQAGWYRDPSVPGQLRYFDGATWTEHVQPDPAQVTVQQFGPPPAAPVPAYHNQMDTHQDTDSPPTNTSRNYLTAKWILLGIGVILLAFCAFPFGTLLVIIGGEVWFLRSRQNGLRMEARILCIAFGTLAVVGGAIFVYVLLSQNLGPAGACGSVVSQNPMYDQYQECRSFMDSQTIRAAVGGGIAILVTSLLWVAAVVRPKSRDTASSPQLSSSVAPQPQPYPQQAPMAPGPAPGPPPALPQSTGHDPFANGFERTHELPQAQPPADGSWYG